MSTRIFSTARRQFALRPSLYSFRFGAVAATVAATALLAGCGGSHTPGNTTSTPDAAEPGWSLETAGYAQTATTKPWTFLVYMGSANNLDTDALANVNQMEHVGSTSNLNVVVQIKRASGTDTNTDPAYPYDTSDGGWTGSRRYYIGKDTNDSHIASEVISTNAGIDSGDPATLQAFVQWGIANFPAQHYCLVVWNHGSGWRSETIGATKSATAKTTNTTTKAAKTRGVSFDDASSDYIRTTELPAAIDMGGGKKWDLLIFDASLMQMMEVADQIKSKTSYILGSEESPPAGGYPYDQILADLNANPTWSGVTFGSDIAQKTLAFYETGPTIGGQYFDTTDYADFVTQSVIDTSKLTAVETAFNNLGAALQSAKGSYSVQIAAARDATEQYGIDDLETSDPTYLVYESYRDGQDFLNHLTTLVADSGVKSTANAALAALQAATVVNYHGSSHPNSHGLSFYIPSPGRYAADDRQQMAGDLWEPGTGNDRYASLSFPLAAPNWQTFLVNAAE